jgi:hypothetical protein
MAFSPNSRKTRVSKYPQIVGETWTTSQRRSHRDVIFSIFSHKDLEVVAHARAGLGVIEVCD